MPTLVDWDEPNESQPYLAIRREQEMASASVGLPDESSDIMNDTTLSGSMLEAALEAMSIDKQKSLSQKTAGFKPAVPDPMADKSVEVERQTSHKSPTIRLPTADNEQDISPYHSAAPLIRPRRSAGSNEELYRKKYLLKVCQWIEHGEARYPGELKDYRKSTTPEKIKEQQRVMTLLSRLGISGGEASFPVGEFHGSDDDEGGVHTKQSERSVRFQGNSHEDMDATVDSDIPLGSNNESISACDADATTVESLHDPSALLFSPPVAKGDAKTPLSTVRFASSRDRQSDSFSSVESVEQARAQSLASSPSAIYRKRMASMSGKRGADQVRVRMELDLQHDSQDTFPLDDASPYSYHSPMRGMSPVKASFFHASQSPISTTSASPVNRPDKLLLPSSPHLSCNDDDRSTSSSEGGVRHTRDSITDTMWESSRKSNHPFKDATRHNIALKAGAVHHYKALPTINQRSTRTQSFLDPLSTYDGPTRRRLAAVYDRLHRRDTCADGRACAVVVSLTEQHIRDVTLKLILSNPPVLASQSYSESQRSLHAVPLEGQTLVVLREKDDLAAWSSAFRGGAPFSVLDFLTLPVKQRKSQSTAVKLTKYGVVLTTFDALKSSDMSYLVDSSGYVVQRPIGDDGWFRSRDSSQTSCQTKQFTVLHGLCWQRVIFVDIVGRKSYLAKADTSRSIAATAVSSLRRYVFFVDSAGDESTDKVQAVLRSDKTAVSSLNSVLRSEQRGDRDAFKQLVIDLEE